MLEVSDLALPRTLRTSVAHRVRIKGVTVMELARTETLVELVVVARPF